MFFLWSGRVEEIKPIFSESIKQNNIKNRFFDAYEIPNSF